MGLSVGEEFEIDIFFKRSPKKVVKNKIEKHDIITLS